MYGEPSWRTWAWAGEANEVDGNRERSGECILIPRLADRLLL